MREADIATFYRWQDDEKHWERYTCRPVERLRPYSAFAVRYVDAQRLGRQVVYSIFADHVLVGRLTAFDYNPRNRSMEIGYYLASAARGRGIGSEALRQFTDVLFTAPYRRLHKLYATTADDNAASRAILVKAGFQCDGRLREHYLVDNTFRDQLFFSLLRDEWVDRRSP